MAKKKTHQEFVKEVEQLVGEEYSVIGQYIKSSIPLEMRHNVCGHIYPVRPSGFKRGNRCPECTPKLIGSKLAKTHEQFEAEMKEWVGNEYELLTPYVSSSKNVQMRHQVCGHTYLVSPSNFRAGKRCPKCSRKKVASKNRKTHEQYCEELRSKVGHEFEVLTPYRGVYEPIQIFHTLCGGDFTVGARQFARFPTCHCCQRGSRKISHEQFCQRVFELFNDEYTVLGTFKTTSKKVLMRHNTCDREYEMYAGRVWHGGTCIDCRYRRMGDEKIKPKEVFLEELSELVGDEYSVVGDYIGATMNVELRHNTCGHVYPVKPVKFIAGRRCPECYGTRKLTQEEFEAVVQEEGKGEYEVLGQYVNAKTEIELKHLVCGHVYEVRPNNFKSGKRCPKCNKSHGEQRIDHYLKENEIPYLSQYTIFECRQERPLPFDFAILNEAGVLCCLVEFDGEQHFYPIESFGGEEAFKRTQKSDEIKTQYCEDHDIILIRIPYWLRDYVEEVLEYWLKYYQIID